MKAKIIILIIFFTLLITGPVLANDFPFYGESSLPYTIEGIGTFFEIKDSEYLNISLKSSEEIKVVLESIPRLYRSENNLFYHNNFINNPGLCRQVCNWPENTPNSFDNGLPSGGNFWSDYIGVDEKSGPNQDQDGSDGIGDTPYCFYGGCDRYPFMKESGWEIPINQPPTFSNLNQYKSDGITVINEGQITTESTVIFKATLSDPDNDQIKLQIELKEFNQPFDGTDLLESDFVSPDATISITRYDLINGQYHWRARAIDFRGAVSDWQEFGEAGNVDFTVKTLQQAAADLAKELVNQPYLWGGKGWDYKLRQFVSAAKVQAGYDFYLGNATSFGSGVDCSGLIMWAYNRSFDPNKPRFENFVKAEGADEQFRENTESISEVQLKRGDVLFSDFDNNGFIDHVAMYVGESGGFDVVNAANRDIGIIPDSKDRLKEIEGFVGFKRVISILPPKVLISAASPVDLTITDPNGFTITSATIISSEFEFLRQIPGELYYSEIEQGPDGNPIDQVYSYNSKLGDYKIKVIPASDSSPTDTYTLTFTSGENTIILTSNTPIADIPTEPYVVRFSEQGIERIILAKIRIEPETLINISSKGVFTVFIQIEKGFGVTIHDINPNTITISGAKPIEAVISKGSDTLIAKFKRQDLINAPIGDQVKLILKGKLFGGIQFEGSDVIRIIQK